MNTRPLSASGLLLATGVLVLGLASPASAACDSYSGNCPTTGGGGSTSFGGNGGGASSGGGSINGGASSGATLPFTGGELVLLSTVGIGALAGGTALVLAGRRKAGSSTDGVAV